MITISINDFNIFEDINSISNHLLIIENKHFLYSFLNDMFGGCVFKEYIKLFDENEKSLKLTDYVDLIPSVVHMDVANKKNINALLRFLKKDCHSILNENHKKIIDIANDTFNFLNLESPIDMVSDIKFNEDDLLKVLNISIKEDNNNLLERIVNYIDISFELRNIKLFIFYNLFSFLEENEIFELLKTCNYKGVSIINIENHNIESRIFDKKKILDCDLCLI